MKKRINTIKFWLFNRITLFTLLCFVILIILGGIGNPYLNAVMFFIMFFCWISIWGYLIEERNANASERLMNYKINKLLE